MTEFPCKIGHKLRSSIRDDLSKGLKWAYNFQKMMAAIPSAMMLFFVGHRITPLLRPWLTMTKRASKPLDRGSPVIRS